MKTKVPERAFTLVELLVVIGVIAVLAGGIGVALSRGDSGVALQNAQNIVASSISNVKSVAALNQATAGLYLNVDPDSDGFLREIRIGYAASVDHDGDPITPNENVRIQRGDPTLLPQGAYIVPREGALAAEVDFTGTWTNLKSSRYVDAAENLKLGDGTTNVPGTFHLLVDISPRGNPDLSGGNRITLAPAQVQVADKLVFDRPEAIRAIVLSRYGFTSFVNNSDSL